MKKHGIKTERTTAVRLNRKGRSKG